jgi:hypothetical protein
VIIEERIFDGVEQEKIGFQLPPQALEAGKEGMRSYDQVPGTPYFLKVFKLAEKRNLIRARVDEEDMLPRKSQLGAGNQAYTALPGVFFQVLAESHDVMIGYGQPIEPQPGSSVDELTAGEVDIILGII